MQKKDPLFLTGLAVTVFLLAATGVAALFSDRTEPREKPAHIRAILELAPLADTSKALIIGYHYDLVKRFAADNGQSVSIGLTGHDRSYLDSLRNGTVDLVVVPWGDSFATDSLLVSSPVDSLSVWLMREDDKAGMRELNDWIDRWHASPEYPARRELFLKRYNAFRSGPRTQLSPYDSLIRAQADSLGWDWHLLAAIMYSESRFHIEARSPRGAAGLMQMMPKTAARYGVTDPLDPEMNIAAGAQSLSTLIKRYYAVGDNMTERYKYALAAYNAGIGRIDDCINLARHLGVDPSYWINIVNHVLPLMADEAIAGSDVVKLGPFKGEETKRYVDSIIAVYNRFCQICP
ncbi:MAG: transglycosylase SLT domain-containing protein [Bacteroidales bacterium]|nr:transglycosylase SLT domain-containing protein [Bacteroidales bacterium]